MFHIKLKSKCQNNVEGPGAGTPNLIRNPTITCNNIVELPMYCFDPIEELSELLNGYQNNHAQKSMLSVLAFNLFLNICNTVPLNYSSMAFFQRKGPLRLKDCKCIPHLHLTCDHEDFHVFGKLNSDAFFVVGFIFPGQCVFFHRVTKRHL